VKCSRPLCAQTLGLIAAGWFLLALFAGEIQLFSVLPPIAVPLTVSGVTVLLIGSYFLIDSFRTALDRWPERALVAVHLTRFVGIYFLILSSRGELEPQFAIPAGWGDIAAATGALLLLTLTAPRWLMLVWNTFGLIDILFVIVRAASLRLADSEALTPLILLPLSFLPTLVVPLIIASHVILYRRLLGRSSARTELRNPAVQCFFSNACGLTLRGLPMNAARLKQVSRAGIVWL
jgi:hypothetical protein